MLLHDYLEYFARENPGAPCVEMGEVTFNYSEANDRCNLIAHSMVKAGMLRGDRIAWLSKNCIVPQSPMSRHGECLGPH